MIVEGTIKPQLDVQMLWREKTLRTDLAQEIALLDSQPRQTKSVVFAAVNEDSHMIGASSAMTNPYGIMEGAVTRTCCVKRSWKEKN